MRFSDQFLRETDALDALIESQVEVLVERLVRGDCSEEIETQFAVLRELLQSYSLREELLEKLASGNTTADQQRHITAILTRHDQRVRHRLNDQVLCYLRRLKGVIMKQDLCP